MDSDPLISIVVTTFSQQRLCDVFDLLASLKAQTYSRIEVIFVGEREPELRQRVAMYAEWLGMNNIIVLFNHGQPGLSVARNLGVLWAKGDIVAFLDDDVLATPQWASEVAKAFEDDNIIGVTGPVLPLWDEPSMSWFPQELYWLISCTGWSTWSGAQEVRNAWGMNMAFRKHAFSRCGLFNTKLGFPKGTYEGNLGEDNEFSVRVRSLTGKRIMYVAGAKVWHKVHPYRLTWSFSRRRAYGLGRSRRNLLKFHGLVTDRDALTLERALLRRILTRRIPADLAGLLMASTAAWKRLSVTLWVLFFVALGYYSHSLPTQAGNAPIGRPEERS